MSTRKVTIQLTQAHIDSSIWDDFDMNPISLAIDDFARQEYGVKHPLTKLRGLSCTLSLFGSDGAGSGYVRFWSINMDENMRHLYQLHRDFELQPCSFELEIPVKGAKETNLVTDEGMPEEVIKYRNAKWPERKTL